jgi:hypothetical protein
MGCNGAVEKAFWQWLLNRARPLNPVVALAFGELLAK